MWLKPSQRWIKEMEQVLIYHSREKSENWQGAANTILTDLKRADILKEIEVMRKKRGGASLLMFD